MDREHILIGVCYRSTSSNEVNNRDLCDMIGKAASVPNMTHVVIMGDFNYTSISWDNANINLSADSELFYEVINDNLLVQHMPFNTRFREGNIPSKLDLLFTNEEEMIEDVKSIPALGRSDHIGVTFRIVVSTSILAQTHEANMLNYPRADYTRMNEQFGSINWVYLFDSKSVQQMWDFFCVKYESVVRACTPAYNSNRHNKAPWYTAKVKKQCSKKKQMWSRYLSTGRFIDYKEYKEQNNKTIATIRDAKAGYEKKLIVNYKKRPKPFFKYMRSKQKTKTTVRNLKKENGDLTGNDTETASLLQKFFLSTFTHEDETTTPELPLKIVESQMEDLTITRQEVCNLMKSLKEDKSPGVDNVHPKVLSRCHETLSHPLQLIFSQSLLEGKLPQQWKDANVTPLHKKGPKSEVGNYRPVSLTSIPCKLLETIIRSRIVQYLEQSVKPITTWIHI